MTTRYGFFRLMLLGMLGGMLPDLLFGRTPGTEDIHRLIDAVSKSNLIQHILTLESAGGTESRVTFTPGNDSAATYIRQQFDALQRLDSVVDDTFFIPSAAPPLDKKPQVNIIASITGKRNPSQIFIIGAHYDCSASRMGTWNSQWKTLRAPGADDNATGVATIIELARVLSDSAYGFVSDCTMRFVAFASEESNPSHSASHAGSVHYVDLIKSRGDQIIGMVSIDMVGYNRNYQYQSIISNGTSDWLGRKFVTVNDSNAIGLRLSTQPFPTGTYSDHASFWSGGFSAVCLMENAPPWSSNAYYAANPVYHTSADTFQTLNMDLVRRVAQMTLGVIVSIGGSVTGVKAPELPAAFVLHQNYPNPFNPMTEIGFRVPETGWVSLKVYDVLGREIATLVERVLEPGSHMVRFEAGMLASGVYLYRLRAGTLVETKKMVLLH